MAKMKTHKGSAKRFRVTRNGKVLARKTNRRHNLEHKPAKRKRRLRQVTQLSPGDQKRVKKLLPYG